MTEANLLARLEKLSPARQKLFKLMNDDSARQSRCYPLAYAQQRLWFMNQLESESAAYNISFAFKLTGQLDQKALKQSFEEIVRRHGILRTRFPMCDGVAVQEVLPDAGFVIEQRDLGHLLPGQRELEVARIAETESQQPFDLAHGPVIRVKLLACDEMHHALFVSMHHIVSDGWSIEIMVKEFALLYQAYTHGQPSPLPKLKMQYADYAVWQRDWLDGKGFAEQLEYWRQNLKDVSTLELPAKWPRSAVRNHAGVTLPWRLTRELSTALIELSQREGATLFMTLLACYQIVLSRYSGQADIAIGSPIAGRRWTETENLIGFFINTLVLRTVVDENLSFREMLSRVRTTVLAAYDHQDAPFEKIVEDLQPSREAKRAPLFQVMLVLQNSPRNGLAAPALDNLEITSISNVPVQSKQDLTLYVWEDSGSLTGSAVFKDELFSQGVVREILITLESLINAVSSNSTCPIGSLPSSDPPHMAGLLSDFASDLE
jgi:NRPS condensation-like uncharacterized protein